MDDAETQTNVRLHGEPIHLPIDDHYSKMIPYVIRQGDHLPKLAVKMGFEATTVWNDPKNKDLRMLRTDWHMLCAGDILYVPEAREKNWFPVQVGQPNRFVANIPQVKISVAFRQGGKPLSNATCIVHGLLPPNQFTTDGDGKLSFNVPVSAESVTVEFSSPHFIQRLRIGHLDPIEELSGIYQRLKNLGICTPAGPLPSGFDNMAMSEAVAVFQGGQNLP